jgi:diadenosine tetraphosphate (Ap4A) HIT family hydrolase
MSNWNTDEWEGLISGSACPICRRGQPRGIVAELDATYLTCGENAVLRGYCVLVLKRHVVEPHELSAEEAFAFMRDLQRVGRVVQELTGAVKMNYEIHGNTIPHLHLHIFPRYRGDPFEDQPIDPRRVMASPYEPGEFAAFTQALRSSLKPV